jgi:uncharacterized protein (DUF1330 family)
MAFELQVGLFVSDHQRYAQYRAEMTPLLHAVGGRFRYDFEVSRVLQSEVEHPINRVFAIRFPDEETRTKFFSDPRYKAIRQTYFESAVQHTTILAEYSC